MYIRSKKLILMVVELNNSILSEDGRQCAKNEYMKSWYDKLGEK